MLLADVLTRNRVRGGPDGRLPGILQALMGGGGGRIFRVGSGGEESLQ